MSQATLATSTGILRFLFDFNHQAITRNLKDFTHEESLIVPAGGANPANFVLGHILNNRSFILELVGEQPLWNDADGEPYESGSKGLDPAKARLFDSLLEDLEQTQERLRRGLEKLPPEQLDAMHAETAKRPRGAQLHFMAFHEGYHAGQLGLLRRIVGKAGAI
jgi:uncharacterized damage-inducible protein DinB